MSADELVETVLEQTGTGTVFTYPGSPARHIYAAIEASDAELVQGVREQHLLHLAQTRYYRELADGREEVPVVVVAAGMGESMVFQPLIAGSITAPCLVVVAESRYAHVDDSRHVYHQTDRGRSVEQSPVAEALNDHENVVGRVFLGDADERGQLVSLVERIRRHRGVGIVHLPTYAYAEERVALDAATRPRPTGLSLDDLGGRFGAADRPMLVAGRGARHPDTLDALEVLATRSGAVVGTTLHMDGFVETNHVGRVGMLGTPAANEAMFEADLVVTVGSSVHAALTSMDPETIRTLRPKLVQVEASPDHRSRFAGAHVDAQPATAIEAMAGRGTDRPWFDPPGYGNERFHDAIPEPVVRLGQLLCQHCPETVVNLGVGNTTVWLPYALGPEVKKEVSRAGSMGETAGALNREEDPILVLGDGELEMDLSLLLEAIYQDSSATVFVLNNGRLGMVTEKQAVEHGERLTPKRRPIEYDRLGEAFDGVASHTVDATDDLDAAFHDAVSSDGVAVVAVPVEQHLSPELFDLERLPRLEEPPRP